MFIIISFLWIFNLLSYAKDVLSMMILFNSGQYPPDFASSFLVFFVGQGEASRVQNTFCPLLSLFVEWKMTKQHLGVGLCRGHLFWEQVLTNNGHFSRSDITIVYTTAILTLVVSAIQDFTVLLNFLCVYQTTFPIYYSMGCYCIGIMVIWMYWILLGRQCPP